MGVIQNLSAALQGATAWTFQAATLRGPGMVKTPDGAGGFTVTSHDVSCLAKLDQKQGYTEENGRYTITRILILASSVTITPEAGMTLQLGSPWDNAAKAYKFGPIRLDGIASHYVCECV